MNPIPVKKNNWFGHDKAMARFCQDNLDGLVKVSENWPSNRNGTYAGYTYWGQFIAHDTSGRADLVERSSALDLESLYGNGRWRSGDWQHYRDSFALDGTFRMGQTINGQPLDLLRDENKLAQIPEPRNDHNLVIAQFHVLMQRFHNRAVTSLTSGPVLENVKTARSIVTRIFHHLVNEDYLPTLCDQEILELTRNSDFLSVPANAPLPSEFTSAVFRFGHSIRPAYRLNAARLLETLPKMFQMTGEEGLTLSVLSQNRLPDDWVIDWVRFFHQGASTIDPRTTDAMHSDPPDIARKNHEAGINAELSSGQEVVKQLLKAFPNLESHGISSDVMPQDPTKASLLEQAKAVDQTPLWLFILLEAEKKHNGIQLGPLGSLIVAEVVKKSIEHGSRDLTVDLQAAFEHLGGELHTMQQLIQYVETGVFHV